MTKLREIYKCEICGNLIEILHEGASSLVCCGQKMIKLKSKTADSTTEKHVPIIEKKDNGVVVKVGSTPHPVEEKHYIKFIEVLTDSKVYKAELKPGDKPEAFFNIKNDDIIQVREYCNIHGLWSS